MAKFLEEKIFVDLVLYLHKLVTRYVHRFFFCRENFRGYQQNSQIFYSAGWYNACMSRRRNVYGRHKYRHIQVSNNIQCI